jgi:hypothetical protein
MKYYNLYLSKIISLLSNLWNINLIGNKIFGYSYSQDYLFAGRDGLKGSLRKPPEQVSIIQIYSLRNVPDSEGTF